MIAKLPIQKIPFYGFFGYLLRFFILKGEWDSSNQMKNPLKRFTLKGLEKLSSNVEMQNGLSNSKVLEYHRTNLGVPRLFFNDENKYTIQQISHSYLIDISTIER